MREIKFRAWDKAGKEMFRVIMLSFPVGRDEIIVSGRGGSISLDRHKEERYLMQHTGLHDKNGKEIYEGDIVRKFNSDMLIDPVYRVIWSDDGACFGLESDSTKYEMLLWLELEVIGNIYENPELLEGKK